MSELYADKELRDKLHEIAATNLPYANKLMGKVMLGIAGLLSLLLIYFEIKDFNYSVYVIRSLMGLDVCMIIVGILGIKVRDLDNVIKYFYYILMLITVVVLNVISDMNMMTLFIFPIIMSTRYCSKNFCWFVFFATELQVVLSVVNYAHSDFMYYFATVGAPVVVLVLMTAVMVFGFMERNLLLLVKVDRARDKEKEYQQRLVESKRKLAMSQVQPHFIYNTLNSIAALCDVDPKQAKKLTIDFTNYIRTNLRTIDQTTNIPFEKELEHTKTYLNIEQVRFEDKLNVVYDIAAIDFEVPPLTLQPFVENAVKHGICQKEEGGTLYISSSEYDDRFEVVCKDTGVGFTKEELDAQKNDARGHIGINNVRERVAAFCGGDIEIESIKGEGTTITIIIPKSAENTELK